MVTPIGITMFSPGTRMAVQSFFLAGPGHAELG